MAPMVNVPPASAGSPARSASQRSTRRSIAVAARESSATAMDWLSAATTGSVQIAAGSGHESWCAMCIGSCSQAALGMTSCSTRSSTSANGRPAAGAGSSKRACTSACGGGTGVAPARAAAR